MRYRYADILTILTAAAAVALALAFALERSR